MHRMFGTLLTFSAFALAACNAKDTAKTDTTTPAQAGAPVGTPTSTAATAVKASFNPATHVVVLHAKDFAFDAPDTITAGWTTFHLVNDGPGLHHAQLVRIDSRKTFADFKAAMDKPGPPPRWAVFVGGPNAPDPNSESDATVNLQPGQYAVLCVVDIPNHVPHFTKGMIRPLTVTAASGAPAPEPSADATVALSDYAFSVQGSLNAGKHTIKVVNKGPQPHEMEIVRLAPGKTSKDFMDYMAKAYAGTADGPPPANALGGLAAVVPGMPGYVSVDLTPGNYAFYCFVPDAKDGKAHVEHGMSKEFKVQ
jgi:hypothetical protein